MLTHLCTNTELYLKDIAIMYNLAPSTTLNALRAQIAHIKMDNGESPRSVEEIKKYYIKYKELND